MKITKRQLKRIIREEYSRLKKQGLIKEAMIDFNRGAQIAATTGRVAKSMPGALPMSRKAKQWLSWAEGYGLNPEEDNEGQLLFYFDFNDDVDGSIVREAERMGAAVHHTYSRDGNMVIYTGEYTSEIDLT